jgi:hypothetical protein
VSLVNCARTSVGCVLESRIAGSQGTQVEPGCVLPQGFQRGSINPHSQFINTVLSVCGDCDLKASKLFVFLGDESMAGHVGVNGVC